MRTFLWLSTVALVAAGLAVVAVADYADRHPNSSLNRGLARMALAWTGGGSGGAEPRCSPDAEEASEPGEPPVLIGFEPEYDDSLLRELKIISELSSTPELIPVPPTEVPASKFATESADEFTPPKAGEAADPFKDILTEVTQDRTSSLIFVGGVQTDKLLKKYKALMGDGRYAEALAVAQEALKLDPESASADAAAWRAKMMLKAAQEESLPRAEEEFIENLRKAKSQCQRIGIDFNVQVGTTPRTIITSDLDIPINAGSFSTPCKECSACGICAILSGVCDCMSDFVAGLFGCNYEVEIGVCPDLPAPPPVPIPQDVHDALMLMSWPRGLPAECCVPRPALPMAGFVQLHPEPAPESWWLPVNEPMPDGRFKISYHRVTPGMPGAMPASVVIPAICNSPYWNPPCAPPPGHVGSPVYPCPTAPVMPAAFVQAPFPVPTPPQPYPQPLPVGPLAGWVKSPVYPHAPYPTPGTLHSLPMPAQHLIMRTQYVAPPTCQPCPPPHVIAIAPPGAVTWAKPGCEPPCSCPRTMKGFAREVTVDFKDQPLCEVLEQFREMAGLNIVCDKPACDPAGVAMDRPVTLKLDKVPCRVALKHVLRYCGLMCKIEDDIVVITTEPEAVAIVPPMPCPMVCPVPPMPFAAQRGYPVATAAVTQACPAANCCEPACIMSSCAKGCCKKECGDGNVVCAPRVKVATTDGTILEIQIIMTKAEPCVEPPVKQAGFNVPEGFDTAGIPVPAIVHPEDLPKAEFPEDLPMGEAFPDFIGFRWDADTNRRARELLVVSEDLRQIFDEWERIWGVDQPSKQLALVPVAKTAHVPEHYVKVRTNVNNDTLHIGLIGLTSNPMHAVLLSANLYAVPALELAAALWPN